MPGLTFFLNFDHTGEVKLNNYLSMLKSIYEVPTLKYTEDHIVGDSFLIYSCVPDFIKDSKLLSISSYIIALDGDFYNENELMDHLKKRNLSKLEIIYYLFKKEGINFAKWINGEFNILFFDTEKQELLATNDRFVRKPFFYRKLANGIIFSSEKKGIIALLEEPSAIDPQGLLELFVFRHNLRGRTFVNNIFNLQTACVLKISRNSFRNSKYFTWDFSNRSKNYNRAIRLKEIADAISKSLEIRLKNKKRIILWLSGGYDSRTLASFINEKYRRHVLTETFGEENSDELGLAQSIADKLGYSWRPQKVMLSYLQVAKIGSWRSEFAVPALDHPFIGNHLSIKEEADYIIQGVPGMNEINCGHLRLGKIFASLGIKPYENFFKRYAKEKGEISFLFDKNYFYEYYEIIRRDFIEFFKETDATNDLYKWNVFNLGQRQPNYSYMADLVENDLFEMLHPFTDINLIPLFTQIPFKDKLFLQITRDLLYKYSPELRGIPLGDGRGYLTKNNGLLKSLVREGKLVLFPSSKSNIWDKKRAIELDYNNIITTINNLLLSENELRQYFNFDAVKEFINNKELLINNQMLFDILLTFTFSYQFLIKNKELKPIPEIVENYHIK